MNYDLIVLGSGPGGYVAAIRAAQLGMNVCVVEKAEIGGICLNWGCIPTKALMKSAQVYEYSKHSASYGIEVNGEVKPNFEAIIARSREVASNMSKGIQYLFKKNKIEVVNGIGKLLPNKKIEVNTPDNGTQIIEAKNIIVATGARSRELPNIKQDGQHIIGYREALTLKKQPESMIVIGSGAIGSEFAYFYSTIGTKVTIVEYMPNLVPFEDEEVSKQLERSFKKNGVKVMVGSAVEGVEIIDNKCIATVNTKKGVEKIEAEIVLSAVGVQPNIENIGLEECGIKIEKSKVIVDDYYKTNIEGYYAIGDIVHGPALAHVASAEGIVCVEKIAGLNPKPVDYSTIPACTYTSPEIASVGLTEQKALEQGYKIKVGKFPYTASGKASASGARDGFIKSIFDENTGKLLGMHMIGANVTEMIAEAVLAKQYNIVGHDILKAIHPHPTMSEAVMESVAAAYGEVIHL